MLGLLAARITNPQINEDIAGLAPEDFINRTLPLVLNIGFVVGALIFLFMLVGGGIAWITSKGDPGSIEEAKSKITNSLIGLLIQFSIYLIIGIANWFFNINLAFGFNINLPVGSSFNNLTNPDAQLTLSSAIEVLLIVAVVSFLFMFLFGGVKYISSHGEPAKIDEAKKYITNALIGLTVTFAIFFVGYLVNFYFGTTII